MSSPFRALGNRRARKNNLNSDGTGYYGTRAYDNPDDGLWWRSHTHPERVQIPSEADYIAELYAKVTANPDAFDEFTGAWLDNLIDAQVQVWIARADRVRKEKQKHTEQALWADGHTELARAEARLGELQVKIDQQDENFRRHRDALLGEPGATKAWDSEIKTYTRQNLSVPQLESEHPDGPTAAAQLENEHGNVKALHPVGHEAGPGTKSGIPEAHEFPEDDTDAGRVEKAS